MTIDHISTRLYRIPPSSRWQDAAVTVDYLEIILTELSTNDGLSGTGIAYTVGPGGSAVKALLDDDCAPLVMGADVHDSESIWNRLARSLHRTGPGGLNTFAISAIDTAIWDIRAKACGLPLHKCLGSARNSIPVYASGIDLHMSPAELHAHVADYRQAGFQAVKIKVGCPTAREDVERVAAAREALGSDGKLLLDANQGWTLSEAARRMKMLETFDPYWIEEPLMPSDVQSHAELRRVTHVPIAVGESLYTKHQFSEYLLASAADIYQPDVARVGGFTAWMKIAHMCEAWHKAVAPHFMSELSVHAVCAVPNAIFLEQVSGGTLEDLGVAGGLQVSDGVAKPPSTPGHGILFNRERLATFETAASQARESATSTLR